jgi:hypothetical protein
VAGDDGLHCVDRVEELKWLMLVERALLDEMTHAMLVEHYNRSYHPLYETHDMTPYGIAVSDDCDEWRRVVCYLLANISTHLVCYENIYARQTTTQSLGSLIINTTRVKTKKKQLLGLELDE